MLRLSVVAVLVLLSAVARAQDPLQTDPDKYKLVLENEHVRVLEYRDKPGDKTHRHTHRSFVLYPLSPFRRRLTFGDGHVVERDFAAGEAMWMEAQSHIGENVGSTETHVLLIEVKDQGSTGASQ
jgi:hypothetical protein